MWDMSWGITWTPAGWRLSYEAWWVGRGGLQRWWCLDAYRRYYNHHALHWWTGTFKKKSTQQGKAESETMVNNMWILMAGLFLACDFNGERKGQSFRILTPTPSSSILELDIWFSACWTWYLIFSSVCQALALDTGQVTTVPLLANLFVPSVLCLVGTLGYEYVPKLQAETAEEYSIQQPTPCC